LKDILKCTNPLEVSLFGSIVTNDFDDSSDIDLLIVFKDLAETDQRRRMLQRNRPEIECPLDMICVDKETFLTKSKIGGVCFIAHKSGLRIFPIPGHLSHLAKGHFEKRPKPGS
jgi:predicted nucleotidyltransferase